MPTADDVTPSRVLFLLPVCGTRSRDLHSPRRVFSRQKTNSAKFTGATMPSDHVTHTCRWLAVAILLVPACSPPATSLSGTTADVPATVPGRITAPGRIVPAAGMIVVGAPIGERLETILVAAGDEVKAGEELVLLSGRELRAVEYDMACTQRDEARARIDSQRAVASAAIVEAELGVQQAEAAGLEIAVQEARIEASRANVLLATGELDRLIGLESRLVPSQIIERKRVLVQQADLDLRVQQTMLDKMRLSAAMGRQAAAAKLDAAKANMALVKASSSLAVLEKTAEAAGLRRDLSLVKAPTAGRVLEVCMNEGEIVGPRPVLKMADLSHLHVEAEVDETAIRRIHLGQRATIDKEKVIDGIAGKVVAIGGIVSPEGVHSLGMPASSEQRIVKVRVELDDPQKIADLVNMQVDVAFSESEDATSSPHASDP